MSKDIKKQKIKVIRVITNQQKKKEEWLIPHPHSIFHSLKAASISSLIQGIFMT